MGQCSDVNGRNIFGAVEIVNSDARREEYLNF